MPLFRILMAALLTAALTPLICMGVAGAIAGAAGCELDLASVKPCVVGGADIGQHLLTLGMMGWFLFATLPAAAAIAAVWVAAEAVRFFARRRGA
jgi:hypothetical protein